MEAVQAIAAFAAQPAGLAFFGMAAAVMYLVRRSVSGRRRTD
jgi:hypothetical protein